MYCTNCGKKLLDNKNECEYCGQVMDIEVLDSYDKEKLIEDQDDIAPHANVNEYQGYQSSLNTMYNDYFYENENAVPLTLNKYNRPLSTGSFFAMQVLLLVPVLNIVLILIWSFAGRVNANRKAYARSILAWFLIFSVILLFVLLTLIFMRYPMDTNFWLSKLKDFVNNIPSV